MPDFFAISKILPLFLFPLPLFLLLVILLSAIASRKSLLARAILGVAVVFWAASTPWVADQFARWWEDPRKATVELPLRSDVAVVLGGLTNPLSSTKEHLEFGGASERLLEALLLYKEGRVGAILITSGSGDLLHPEAAEAPELAAFARRWGVPEVDLVVESKSRNTRENASLTLPLIRERGWKTVVLVTSASHMKRSVAVFRKAGFGSDGLSLTTWPVDTLETHAAWPFNAIPDAVSLLAVQVLLKEVVGWAVYGVQGYL
jgi:uncharacterized SAM-binding protein YcdF (DUF218 family)